MPTEMRWADAASSTTVEQCCKRLPDPIVQDRSYIGFNSSDILSLRMNGSEQSQPRM